MIVFLVVDTEIFCPKLAAPENGAVNDGDNRVGTKAVYTCNDGFRLVGSSKRLCQKGGSWAGEAPTCKRKSAIVLLEENINSCMCYVQRSDALH